MRQPWLWGVTALLAGATVLAQAPASGPALRVIAFGAHPDDCDQKAGGTAAKWAAEGHQVKFVSVTNGDAGHQTEGGGALARRRRAEAAEAARRFGIVEYDTLDNHDGQLVPSVDVREQVIRKIRQWRADIVLAPRPNDYHPDHRYTGVLIQDAAYMVVVPNIAPDTPPLRKNPVFLYFQDGFQRPNPFRPDVAVAIDDVLDKKIHALDAHTSQMYEWLPWVAGNLEEVPKEQLALAGEDRLRVELNALGGQLAMACAHDHVTRLGDQLSPAREGHAHAEVEEHVDPFEPGSVRPGHESIGQDHLVRDRPPRERQHDLHFIPLDVTLPGYGERLAHQPDHREQGDESARIHDRRQNARAGPARHCPCRRRRARRHGRRRPRRGCAP